MSSRTDSPTINSGSDPEFVDAKGLYAKFSIKPSLAYLLMKDGVIKTISLRRPGQIRGKRLFDVASVRAYARSLLQPDQRPERAGVRCATQAALAVEDPEFVSFKGLEQKFGIKRDLAYLLIKEKLVRSKSIRRPGKMTGIRLFEVASVREYINGAPEPKVATADVEENGRMQGVSASDRAPLERLLANLIEGTASAVAARAMEIIAEHHFVQQDDPLLTAKEAGQRIGFSDTKIRQLVELGHLKKAPGLIEIRIRQSVVDAYGKPSSK